MSLPTASSRATPDRIATQPLVGNSAMLAALLARARKAAASALPVMITGESGTGKELLARFVHDHSRRADGNYVVINCAAIPRELIESELFGYERGAFTGARAAHDGWFQAAHGGTLVLDEIGELPIELQPKLLRALESGSVAQIGSRRGKCVDVRIVASTNRDLRKECEARRFREDLYHRLGGVTLSLPPLRHRPADLPALVGHFCQKAAAEQGLEPGEKLCLSGRTLQRLEAHAWPGNVRELRHLVWRTVALAGVPLDELTLLAELETAGGAVVRPSVSEGPGISRAADAAEAPPPIPPGCIHIGNKSLAEVQQEVIRHHLRACHGNRRRAAAALGISRTTLYERLRQRAPQPRGGDQP